ncbi:hypothetical protein CAAN1_04S03400 [[Candida] anglica]|uniref:GIY-YIG endonuclease n=1 Tax=[Candida] anglica TaxID=148631 RepID=A0ABP0ECA3_9ASCO
MAQNYLHLYFLSLDSKNKYIYIGCKDVHILKKSDTLSSGVLSKMTILNIKLYSLINSISTKFQYFDGTGGNFLHKEYIKIEFVRHQS